MKEKRHICTEFVAFLERKQEVKGSQITFTIEAPLKRKQYIAIHKGQKTNLSQKHFFCLKTLSNFSFCNLNNQTHRCPIRHQQTVAPVSVICPISILVKPNDKQKIISKR